MQDAIDAYFDNLDDDLPTVTGLALALGFDSRNGLLYYQDEKPAFLSTIKKAKARVEAAFEKELIHRNGSVTGLIFNLKNNFAWKDAQELNHTGADGVPLSLRVEFVDSTDS
jgi:hypothetical protein